jgi:hypothetical protein
LTIATRVAGPGCDQAGAISQPHQVYRIGHGRPIGRKAEPTRMATMMSAASSSQPITG